MGKRKAKELTEKDWAAIAAQQIRSMDKKTKAEWADLHKRYL